MADAVKYKFGRNSKRSSKDSSETHAEAPKPKKKKKETVAAPTQLCCDGANGSEGGKVSSSPSSSQTDAAKTTQPAKKTAQITVKRRNYFKPHNGSWMTHMAALIVHRCVTRALVQSIDPRTHLNDINWGPMCEGLLETKDIKMLWYYIQKEYPDGISLQEIERSLTPYKRLTLDHFIREDIKLKYKDQVPKHPLTAYMLFSKSKAAKVKSNHPGLTSRELAVKLGKKWKALAPQRQEKYKKLYLQQKIQYKIQLEEFYSNHPDARPPRVSPTRRKKKSLKNETSL